MKETIDRLNEAHAAYALALRDEAQRERRYGNLCFVFAVFVAVVELGNLAYTAVTR